MGAPNTTPGPWQVNGSHVYGSDPARDLIAQVLTDNGRLVADRDLIAASGDLYAALQLALEYWAHRQQRYKNRHPAWVQAARAASAHARGEA